MAEILGPGLISLAERGLVVVRRFASWPAPWGRGSPVAREELMRSSREVAAWSDGVPGGVLAAQLTEAGIHLL